jgi:hypothetical protein
MRDPAQVEPAEVSIRESTHRSTDFTLMALCQTF